MGAGHHSRTRFFRAKAMAREAVEGSSLETTVFAPSIMYSPGDPWLTLLQRISWLPAVPISGSGESLYQPMWAEDAADCVMAVLDGLSGGSAFQLAGPEVLSYDAIVRTVLRSLGRRRPLVHVPPPVVKLRCAGWPGSSARRSSRPGRRRS